MLKLNSKLKSQGTEAAKVAVGGVAGCLVVALVIALNLAWIAAIAWVIIKVLFWTGVLPL